jgi:cytochrome oxidase Cu insertion factor (SCO1/SenC/PrrC family)
MSRISLDHHQPRLISVPFTARVLRSLMVLSASYFRRLNPILACFALLLIAISWTDRSFAEDLEDTPPSASAEQSTEPLAKSEKAPATAISIWNKDGLEDFEFTDRTGEKITRKHLLGKEWVIGFMFTRCRGPCPAIVAAMKRLQDETSVNMVLFTVDPEVDTPEVLSRFSQEYVTKPKPGPDGEMPKWYWLTGPRETILSYIQRNFRVPAYGQHGSPEHSNNVMHVDETGHVLGKYLGMESAEMALLRRIIQKKAPRGKMMTNPIPAGAIQVEGAPLGMTFTRPTVDEEEPESAEAVDTGEPKPSAEAEDTVPGWIRNLPAVNASLNGLATILLLIGYILIKSKRVAAHKAVMLSCFATSNCVSGFLLHLSRVRIVKKIPRYRCHKIRILGNLDFPISF